MTEAPSEAAAPASASAATEDRPLPGWLWLTAGMLALVLGIASIVAPRFLNIFVAVFLIAYAVVGFGLLR